MAINKQFLIMLRIQSLPYSSDSISMWLLFYRASSIPKQRIHSVLWTELERISSGVRTNKQTYSPQSREVPEDWARCAWYKVCKAENRESDLHQMHPSCEHSLLSWVYPVIAMIPLDKRLFSRLQASILGDTQCDLNCPIKLPLHGRNPWSWTVKCSISPLPSNLGQTSIQYL
jgi:hypothetical protein